MDLTTEQINVLARIREYGPGTPEAMEAFAEYEAMKDRQEADARRERVAAEQDARIRTLEETVRDLGQRAGSATGHE